MTVGGSAFDDNNHNILRLPAALRLHVLLRVVCRLRNQPVDRLRADLRLPQKNGSEQR